MEYFKKYFNKKDIPINPEFQKMSHEKLLKTMYSLKEENNKQKESLNKLSEQNNDLKNSILNRSKNSSEIKNIYNDLKFTLFATNDNEIEEKNKEFNDFLYDQYLLYSGLEEEEINDLNQLKINEENWSDNKDLFIFKQKIIERNYQELFRNIAASNELQNLFKTEENINNVNDNNINVKEKNTNLNNTKNNNDIKNENNDNKLSTLSDKIGSEKKNKTIKKNEEDKNKDKDKEPIKEKEKKVKSEIKKFNVDSLNQINSLKKKEEQNKILDSLLDNENDDEDEND